MKQEITRFKLRIKILMRKLKFEMVFLLETQVLLIIHLILYLTELIKLQQINKCHHYLLKLIKMNMNKDNQQFIKMMSKHLIKCLIKASEWSTSFSKMMKTKIFMNIKLLKVLNQIEAILMYLVLEKILIQITLEQLLLLEHQSNFQILHRHIENQIE